jgi:hypothetical protein
MNALKCTGTASGTGVRGSSSKIVDTSILDDMQKKQAFERYKIFAII